MHTLIEQWNAAGEGFVRYAAAMLLQSSVLIVLLLAIDVLLRRRIRAVMRYGLWVLVLIKLVLPPGLGAPTGLGYWLAGPLGAVVQKAPGIQGLRQTAAQAESLAIRIETSPDGTPYAGYGRYEGHGDRTARVEPRQMAEPQYSPALRPDWPAAIQAGSPQDLADMAPPAAAMPRLTWQALALGAYATIVGVLLLFLRQRTRFARAICRQGTEPQQELADLLEQCRHHLGMRQQVQLRLSASLASPAACGLRQPVILIPAFLPTQLGREDLRAVLLHELAHIRRGDLWLNLAQTLLQVAYFYNPLLWVANARIRRVREEAVDETVQVAMGRQARQYPDTLVQVAKLALTQPTLGLRLIGVAESRSALYGRVRRMLNRPVPKTARLGAAGIVTLLVLAAALLPMATRGTGPADQASAPATQPATLAQAAPAPAQKTQPAEVGELLVGPMPEAVLAKEEYQGLGNLKSPEPKPSFCRSDKPLLWQDKRSKYASALLFDQSGGPGTAYDTLYVDLDGDRDFDGDVTAYKEEPTDQPADRNRDGTFHNVRIQHATMADTPMTVTVIFKQFRKQADGLMTYGGRIVQSTWAQGRIAIGDRVVPVAIFDRNGNGKFTDQGGFAAASTWSNPRCDFMALMLDGSDQPPSDEAWNRAIQLPLTEYLVLNSGTYRLTAKTDQDRVRLTAEPVELPAGKLQPVPAVQDGRLQLLGEKTLVLLAGVKDSVILPADTYRAMVRGASPIVVAAQEGIVAGLPLGDAKDAPLVVKPAEVIVRMVRRGTGEPLAGANVQVSAWGSAGEQKSTYVTDDRGECTATLSDVALQAMRIKVTSAGMVPMAVRWEAGAAPLPKEYTVPMEPGTTIGGVIKDEQGQPVEGAMVHILVPRQGPDSVPYPDIYDVTFPTDKDGRWKCDYVPSTLNDVWIRLVHPDYASDERFGMTPKPPIEKLRDQSGEMILKRGLTLSGVVVGPDGKPVANAAVKQGRDRFGTSYPSTRTDKEGKFAFAGCKAGKIVLTTVAEGLAPDVREVSAAAGMEPVRIELRPGHRLTARVVDAQGKPMAGALVVADTWRGYRSLEWQTTTDAQGRFVWNSAPADEVLFDILKQGYMDVRRKALAPSEEEQVVTLVAPLHISGTVVDAATGEPVSEFQLIRGIDWREGGSVHWNRDKVRTYRDGKYEIGLEHPYPGHLLRVEAPGYMPAVSRLFSNDEGQQTYDFKLEKGKDQVGTVIGVDGSPLPNARVLMAVAGQGIMIQNGRDTQLHDAVRLETDEQGKFRIPPQTDTYMLVVIEQQGIAQVTQKEFEADPRIRLKSWGRVEGTLRVGAAPGAKEHMSLMPQDLGVYDPKAPQVSFHYETQTNDDGKFAFERVVPGEASVRRAIKLSSNRTSFSHGVLVTVEPGKTVQAPIGGTGRPVVGKVRLPVGSDRKIDWAYCYNSIMTRQEPIEPPAELKQKGQEAIQQWYMEWMQSDEGKARRRAQRHFTMVVRADGTFRVEDIPAGTYQLHITANEPPAPDQCGYGEAIGSVSHEFTVPEMEGGRSDEPLDIGTLELTVFRQLNVGEEAPSFEVSTLDGEPLRLSDYRGKYVLLDFWATWCGPCVAETPHLKAVAEKFGKDKRLAIVSLSLDPKQQEPKEYVRKENLAWIQGFLGDWSKTKLPSEHGVRGIPAIFLIGPDGRVIAKDLRGTSILATVEKALASPEVEPSRSTSQPAAEVGR